MIFLQVLFKFLANTALFLPLKEKGLIDCNKKVSSIFTLSEYNTSIVQIKK